MSSDNEYRDFSMETCSDESKYSLTDTDGNFPVKLHRMLRGVEASGQAHIVGFRPHGRCFMVHRHREFVEEILPKWFRQTKFSSFLRQLNVYGFIRMKKGPDKSAYYHEKFLRGKPSLAATILPIRDSKSKEMAKQAAPKAQPNFYQMTSLPGGVDSTRNQRKTESPAKPTASMSSNHGTAAHDARSGLARLADVSLARLQADAFKNNSSFIPPTRDNVIFPGLHSLTTTRYDLRQDDSPYRSAVGVPFRAIPQPYMLPPPPPPPPASVTLDLVGGIRSARRRDEHRALVSQFVHSVLDPPRPASGILEQLQRQQRHMLSSTPLSALMQANQVLQQQQQRSQHMAPFYPDGRFYR